MMLHVGGNLGEDLGRRHRLHEADVALGKGGVRQNRLRAWAAITTVHRVDRERRVEHETVGDWAVRGFIEPGERKLTDWTQPLHDQQSNDI
jgi:hypothetical protein